MSTEGQHGVPGACLAGHLLSSPRPAQTRHTGCRGHTPLLPLHLNFPAGLRGQGVGWGSGTLGAYSHPHLLATEVGERLWVGQRADWVPWKCREPFSLWLCQGSAWLPIPSSLWWGGEGWRHGLVGIPALHQPTPLLHPPAGGALLSRNLSTCSCPAPRGALAGNTV